MNKQHREIVTKIVKEFSPRVTVHCDEYHGHSAFTDCLTASDPKDLSMAILYAYIQELEYELDKIRKIVQSED